MIHTEPQLSMQRGLKGLHAGPEISSVSSVAPLSPIFSHPSPPVPTLCPAPWFSEALTAASASSGLDYTILCDIILLYYALLPPPGKHSLTFGPGKPLSPTLPSSLDRGAAPAQAALPTHGGLSPCLVNWQPLLLSRRAVGLVREQHLTPAVGWHWAQLHSHP